MAQEFAEQFQIRAPIYVDPQRHLYQALGMSASKAKMLNPKVLWAGFKASQKGFRQTKLQGDPWQLGGVLLLKPSGEIPYLYRSKFAGDHPEVDAVLQALQG